MTTVRETPGEAVLATAPVTFPTRSPTIVPQAEGEYATPVDSSNVKATSAENTSSLKPQEWDYGQKGGADFNMEAPILEEDVIKAGGLGARDELNSFLPAAVDVTDYEESLKDAMEYENVPPEVDGEIPRPGIGFVKSEQQQMDGFRDVEQA